jgi:hypothetical protein
MQRLGGSEVEPLSAAPGKGRGPQAPYAAGRGDATGELVLALGS